MFTNTYCALFFLSMALIVSCDAKMLDEVRDLYRNVEGNEKVADRLFEVTKGMTEPLFFAYNGVAKAVLASFKWNPYSKLRLVQEGCAQLNKASKMLSSDIEIRMLRLSVEINIPAIISIDRHIDEDRAYLKKHFDPNHPMADVIKHFLD
ncbi:hypothetical protein GEMRC1_009312 [Eukaryota sp. GEM-RC1]